MMKSLPYIMGVVCGVAVALVAYLVFYIRHKRKYGTERQEYDERQEWARGKSYKYGFYTLLVCVLAGGIARELFGIRLFDSVAGTFLLVLPGFLVFIISCIWKEAYLKQHEKLSKVSIGFSLLALVNLGCAVQSYWESHSFLVDGSLGRGSMNLLCAILLLIVVAAMGLRRLTLREESDEDE
ncbi:MAG: hypothetical protein ACI4PM_00765 [Butyricicoccus sp.]